MRNRQNLALFAALSLVLGLPAPAMAAAFSNGNFESPSVIDPYVPITSPGVIAPGWTVTGDSVDHGSAPAGTSCWAGQCVDLNGDGPGGIEQTFDTQVGDSCTVEFYMSRHRDLASSSATMYASIDRNPPASFTHSAAGVSALDGQWEPNGFTFTVGSSPTTLAFTSGMTTGAAGPQIDEVTVTCSSPSPQGQLKVCKVAGPGLATGTSFTFTAGSAPPFTVPAGTGPGGTCTVGPSFPQGSTVTVAETVHSGIQVTGITVAPSTRLVGTPNLAGGSVDVTIGTGVTEVTFKNRKGDTKSGYLQICKEMTGPLPVPPSPAESFTFYVKPGNLGPFVVPVGSCSPAIEVAAGTAIITEVPSPGFHLADCSTIPAGQQGPCDSAAGTSTVTVDGGDVSTQTIAFLTNRRQRRHRDE